MMLKVVIFVACGLLIPAVASDTCAASDKTCNDDATSLIQQSMAVQHHSAPAPAPKGSDADEVTAEQSFTYKMVDGQWDAMRKSQLNDMLARQKNDDGCKYGANKDGTCVPAYSNDQNVFSNYALPAAKGAAKKLLLLEGESLYPMVIPFTKEDHDLIPLHRRIKWERQRRGKDPHTLHSLVSITDSQGNTVTPKEEELSLVEEQFPLAVTMHAPPAAGCPANDGTDKAAAGEKPKTGEGFNIDIQKMLSCQVVHAEQVLKDMEGQQKATDATFKKATDAYKAGLKKLKDEQDKQAKTLNEGVTKDHSDIEAKYPCGFGAKAGAFFGKVFGKDTKAADECMAKRKLAVQDADKKGKAAMDKMVAAMQTQKDAVQKTMDDAKEDNEKFKKTLRDAKTQKFMLPIVMMMTSDKVMSKLQKVDNFMQKPGEPDAGPDAANSAIQNEATTKGLNGINDQDAKEFYVKQKLSAVIVPFYNEAVSIAQAAMWNVLDFIKSVAQTSLMSLVGAIPFVGGVLSAIVAIVFDCIWVMFEHHVNAAFLNLANIVIDKVLDAMVKPIMSELKDTKGAVKTVKAADKKTLAATQTSSQAAVTGPAQKNLEAEAKKAAASAGGAKTSTSDFVKDMATGAKSDKSDQDKLEQTKYEASSSLLQIQVDYQKHPLFQEHKILTTHPLYKDL